MAKKHIDWGNYPIVDLTFWVVKPFDTRQVAQLFLETLEHHGLSPDQIDIGHKKNHFVPLKKHLDEYYRDWLEVPPREIAKIVSLRRTRNPHGSMSALVDATGGLLFDLLWVELGTEYFHKLSHQKDFLQMGQDLYNLVNPAYGMLEYSVTRRTKTGPIGLADGLPGIFWGNFLGPEYSAMFGWGRLEALAKELPVTVMRLPDDGVLIVLGEQVLDSGSAEMLDRAEAVERFLGEEYFSKTQPSKPLPFSMADAIAGRVPAEILRKHLLPPKPERKIVPEFRYRELRRQRQEEWEKSGGITVEEIVADLGLELKGPGGVIVVDAETGKGVDLPGEMFEDETDKGEGDNSDP